MSSALNALPPGFEALEPYVDHWLAGDANSRMQLRLDSEASAREAFFLAGKDLVLAALELLDKTPLEELNDSEQRLMQLLLSLAHVAQAVEIQGDDEPMHAHYARFITITRASADTNP